MQPLFFCAFSGNCRYRYRQKYRQNSEKTLLYAGKYSILNIFMVSVPAHSASGGP